jgi:GNAT superfamily N-acetyltransferase
MKYFDDKVVELENNFQIRAAKKSDFDFLLSLTARLAGIPGPAWHDLKAMMAFQERFMAATLATPAENSVTLIATSKDGQTLGYVHAYPGKDGVTDEPCGYVAILALKKNAEGKGIAGQLMKKAEDWARTSGYRFLSLDAFATNQHAIDFYTRGGFMPETIRLVKPL